MAKANLGFAPSERFTLSNGLVVLVQPLPSFVSISLGLHLRTGSRDESPDEAGLCHLVEHMLFQGTARRDVRELSRVLAPIGGNLDAATGREGTTFFAKVPQGHLGLALDVLGDMVLHSRFAPALLEKEKQIILEEMRMVEDTPDEWVHDLFQQALWPRHPLGRPIIGTPAVLRGQRRVDLLRFMRRHFTPRRLMLSVAGPVSARQVRQLAERTLGGLPPDPVGSLDGPQAPALRPSAIAKVRRLEQVHLCLGGTGVRHDDPRRLAALVLSNILGGGPNSRLFYEVRERRALSYAVYSFADCFRDTGVFGLYLACHPGKLRVASRVVLEQLERLTQTRVTPQELRDAVGQMKGGILLSLENSSTHMWHLLQQETYLRRHLSWGRIIAELDRLTRQDLLVLAQELLEPGRLTWAVLGPCGPSPESFLP